MTISTKKNLLSISLFATCAFLIFNIQAFAATSTANKPIGSSSREGNVIYALGGYAELRADIIGGTGTGFSSLYEVKKYWPDPELTSINVNDTNKPAANLDYYLTRNIGYYVKAHGDSNLNLTGK